jgi:hypothetical protein
MKVGDLVKHTRGLMGIIVEVPAEDDYWGKTAVIQWTDTPMYKAEHTEEEFEVLEVISASR